MKIVDSQCVLLTNSTHWFMCVLRARSEIVYWYHSIILTNALSSEYNSDLLNSMESCRTIAIKLNYDRRIYNSLWISFMMRLTGLMVWRLCPPVVCSNFASEIVVMECSKKFCQNNFRLQNAVIVEFETIFFIEKF